jgi:hypothetical protein
MIGGGNLLHDPFYGGSVITEAEGNGFYHSEGWNRDYPKLQILTIEDLLTGKQPDMPPSSITFKQAERMGTQNKDQGTLGF